MDFPTAKVKFKTYQNKTIILEKVLRMIKTFSACECNSTGSTSCSSSGECICKSNVVGINCTACEPRYYGFPDCQGEN